MAKRKGTKGTHQIGAEVDETLLAQFKTFCAGRGETLRYHIEMAMRRHLANPPEVEKPTVPPVPPLPPITVPAPKRRKS